VPDERSTRRLAAILSADVVGYSRLMETDESGTLAALKKFRAKLIDPGIAQYGGRIVGTAGDGLLCEFPSVVDAVQCAVDIQRAMRSHNEDLPEDRRMQLRIGVNLGDVLVEGDDIFGDGVNVAARLESAAPPGGLCVSETVHSNVMKVLDVPFVDAGRQQLKNIAEPLQTYMWTPGPAAAPTGSARRSASPVRRRRAIGLAVILVLAGLAVGYFAFLAPMMRDSDRVESATEAPAIPESERISVAVLPFINQSGDPSQEYFSDGLTEDVIAALGKFTSLKVMARNAVFPFKDRNVMPAEIGRELGVQYLVEASVRRTDTRIRVHAQLTEAATGELLWSQQYEESLSDMFAVQDAISLNVAGALEVSLTRAEQERLMDEPTRNMDAYDLVLRGRALLREGTRASNREGRQLLEQAIETDPDYASAYAWLAEAYLDMADFGWIEDPAAALDYALELSEKGVSLDPDNVDALAVKAYAHVFRGEYDLALTTSDRLLQINPSSSKGLIERLSVLTWVGRIDEAIEAGEQALRFDPNLSSGSLVVLGLDYYLAGRHEDAVRLLEPAAQRFPDNSFIYAVMAAAYAQMDRLPEASRALAAVRRLNPFFDPESFGSRFRNPDHRAYLQQGISKAAGI